jgi:hypothetical protein
MVNAYRFGASALVTSIGLADVVADAVGITRESAQLHLKTIRAAGEITFKGYGRAAAAMASLDASRLLLAVAGSTFAKDSLNVLRRFADLKPIGDPREKTLEEFLAYRIELLPGERNYAPNDRTPPELLRLPQIAMELMWPANIHSQDVPPCAIMRWITVHGDIRTLTFGSERARLDHHRHRSDGVIYDRYDALDIYPDARMFHVRIVTRDALIDIAKALR